jgi:hypothetical protein
MPLQKLQFRPGVNREGTTLSNEGGWFDCDKIRFRSGYPEKIGGWQADGGAIYSTAPTSTLSSGGTSTSTAVTAGTGAFWGVAKSLWNWINLIGYNLLSVGTNLKFYIQNSAGGAFNDVTPIRLTTAAGTPTFAATNGSATIVVTSSGHGAQTGDFVIFSGAASLGGNITATVLNKEYQVISVTSNNTFTITATATANGSDTGTGGASTVANFQLTTGYTTFTLGTGWGAGGWGGSTGPAFSTSINGGTAVTASSTTAITVVSTTGFAASGTIYIGSEGITYTAVTATTFAGTITRGVNSTAVAHADLSPVYQYASTATGWGSPATTGIGIQLRLWSQSNYGEDLIFNPRGGAMYYWANNASPNTYDRAQIIKASTAITVKGGGTITPDSTCPSVANFVLVSDSSRFVFAFGTNDPSGATTNGVTTQNPLLVRWSNQQEVQTWLPSISNQAGAVTLSHGSTIITAVQTRQEVLVLTDSSIYSFQYLGAPYVWGNQILADNISIASPNAVAVVNNVTYWMGADKFYMYSGRVETLPCALRQYIYGNINLTEAFQIHCGTNEGYNEIWWFYPSITGTTADGQNGTGTAGSPNTLIDRYVIYNHLERTWYYGTLNGTGGTVDGLTYGTVRPRTAWLDSPLRAEPTAAIGYNSSGAYTNGAIVYHETTVDNNEVPSSPAAINAFVQSSDFDIGDGHNFGFVWRLIPDLTFDGSTTSTPGSAPYPVAYFTVRPRQNPGANYGASDDPNVTGTQSYAATTTYNVQQFTQQVYVRIRGRQMAFKIESVDIGTQWQLGAPRIDVRPDGRR